MTVTTGTAQDDKAVHKCSNPECARTHCKLICPNCKEAGRPLKISSFCSQECYKTFWPIHKLTHDFAKNAAGATADDNTAAANSAKASPKKKTSAA